jgi:hypothetical protein
MTPYGKIVFGLLSGGNNISAVIDSAKILYRINNPLIFTTYDLYIH